MRPPFRGPKKLLLIFPLLAGLAGLSAVVLWLWNALLPGLFGLPHLSFFQAAGLLILARALFGGFGHRGGGHHFGHSRHVRDHWRKMAPEAREAFLRNHPFGEQANRPE